MTPPISRRNFVAASLSAGVAASASGSGAAAGTSANSTIVAMSAVELSAAIRKRQVSCVEVMQAYLKQIDQHNHRFNAIVSLREEPALLAEAARYDLELADGSYRGWMHGFPVAIKDLADAEGLLTTRGSPIFKDQVAGGDSIHVSRMKAAGAIVIGKTNVPEFGLGSNTYNPVFGATLNAYDGVSTAGGSSGGAAAALALQMAPVADGSDFMGSLRNPGAYNNIIGFRPTPGLVPLSGSFIEELPCNGPMGRNVTDTAMLLSTMAGHHPSSPTSLPVDPERFAGPLAREWKNTKIAWLGDFNGYLAMEDGVLGLCESALSGFEAIGCNVDAVSSNYPMDKLWQTWLTFRHWLNRSRSLPLYDDPQNRALLKPEAIWEIEGGEGISGDDVAAASADRAEWYQAVLGLFGEYDFLVLPTAQVFPYPATTHWPKEIAGREMDTYHRWMEVVIPGTLSGCPVVNVPAGFNERGQPMGLQIIGRRYQDFETLQIAYAYEQATRWNLDITPFNA